MVDAKRRSRGRPSGQESVDIEKRIVDLYIQGASPSFIIQETGHHKDTVYAKCNPLLEIAKEQNAKDFREKIEQEKFQFVLSMDSLICRTYTILGHVEERIEKYMNKNRDPPEYLLQKFSDLTKNLMNMKKEKAEKSMQLPLGKELQDAVEEEVAKSGNKT